MFISIIEDINQLPAEQWNQLTDQSNPFLQHAFLSALETEDCIGKDSGWQPRYVIAKDDHQLIGAIPLFLKSHSFGEFVFDWAWANAYERIGQNYYPKLVAAIPFTPATGPRILVPDGPHHDEIHRALIDYCLAYAKKIEVSSLHYLFTNTRDTQHIQNTQLLTRTGCQFHWKNKDYRDFEHYLEHFTSKKRKNIYAERRHVQTAGIDIEILQGPQITPLHWEIFYQFYFDTFLKKGNYPSLSPGFFTRVGQTMPNNILLIMAKKGEEYVASAINFIGTDTLYGRYWGCNKDYNSLHFELCYYTPLQYCIEHKISRFEAGAQGEHKIARGFEPTPTYSCHWIANEQFRPAIAAFLQHETQEMAHYIDAMCERLPFKKQSL